MSLDVTSPVTGSAQTGFSSPTYTLVTDTAPSPNGKQSAVTALGGTQAGVIVHSVSSPFTTARFRPAQLKVLPSANPVTGVIKNIPTNVYKVNTRKGVVPGLNIPSVPMTISTNLPIPAGADTYDAANIRAAISLHIGVLTQLSAALGDTCVSGII
jgi:hypothetical protein